MRYIYIDLGAYNGDTFLQFMTREDLPVPTDYFNSYLFEPNPKFDRILSLLAEKFDNVMAAESKAAWIKNGKAKFALDHHYMPLGSTLMKGKKESWENFEKIEVETFDFPEFLKQFEKDYVVVKMDIEGAEFPILEKLLADGSVKIINQLLCEFHPNKVIEYTTTYNDELIERIKETGVELVIWH